MFQLARIALFGRGFVALGLLAAAVEAGSACSVSSSPAAGGAGGPDGGPGMNVGDSGGPGADGGGPGADGGGDGGGTGSFGLILVSQAVAGGAGMSAVSASVSAQFVHGGTVASGCTVTTVGGCGVTSCPDGASAPTPKALNAGTITVSGMSAGAPAILSFGAGPAPGSMGYAPFRQATKFFDGGDTLTVSGAGGPDLPAFSAQTVIAPNDIVLTAPACASALEGGACTPIDRGIDTMVSWTGGGAGKVSFVYITGSDNGSHTVSCRFDALAGTGTVPSAALMMLDSASAPGFFGQEIINAVDTKTFTVGTFPAEFDVQGTPIEGTFTTN